MKKSISKTAVAIVSLSLMTSYAFAEGDRNNEDSEMKHSTISTSTRIKQEDQGERDHHDKMGKGDEQDDKNNEMDDVEEENNENSLHDHFTQLPTLATTVNLPTVDATKLTTYADIVTVLNQYRDAVNQIKSNEDVTTLASSTLSAQEKAILLKLSTKHSNEFTRVSARTNEILSQIKDLTDMLTPLGTETITTEFHLNDLLVSQLNDFSSMIHSLTNLVDTTTNIIDEETN